MRSLLRAALVLGVFASACVERDPVEKDTGDTEDGSIDASDPDPPETDEETDLVDSDTDPDTDSLYDAPPEVAAAIVATDEDTPLDITLTATDPEGMPLTFAVVDPPSTGTLTGTAPDLTYTPDPDVHGTDTFTFVANDGAQDSAVATVRIDIRPVDDPPVALDGAFTLGEDTPTPVPLQAVEVDGDPLTWIILSPPSRGTLAGTPPAITYVPGPDLFGADSFTFQVRDGRTTSPPATVDLTVTPVNDPPVAVPQRLTLDEDGSVAITLQASDVDGDPLTWVIDTQPTLGTLTGTAPDLVYTPAPDTSGADVFTFHAEDGLSSSATVAVDLTVRAVNDPPVALSATYTLDEDDQVAFSLQGSDPEGDPLTYRVTGLPTSGTLRGVPPNLSWEPDPDVSGLEELTFVVNDGILDSPPATIVFDVLPVNDPPVVDRTRFITDEDTPVVTAFTAVDPEGDPVTFDVVSTTDGSAQFDGSSWVFTPDPDFHGTARLTVEASDGALRSAPTVLDVTVRAVNDVPVADDQALFTVEDVALPITLTGSDVDGDALSFQIATSPAHGRITGAGPSRTYTPDPDYAGTDSFTFRISDGTALSPPATITLDVQAAADVPLALGQAVATDEDTPLALTLEGDDPDGDPLTFQIITSPAHGALSGTAPAVTYTPDPDYAGTDSFLFTVSDGTSTSPQARVDVTVRPINDRPLADDQTVRTDEDVAVDVTLTGSDADGDTLTFAVLAAPSAGTLGGVPPDLTWQPPRDQAGTWTMTFVVGDGRLDSAPATITFEVDPVNDRPTADALSFSTPEDTPVVLALTGSDPDGDPLTFVVTRAPIHGTLDDSTGDLVYTPDRDYVGPDDFLVRASDGVLESPDARIRIDVVPENDPPVAVDSTITVFEDGSGPLVLQASDADGDPLAFTILTPPAHGTLSGTAPALTYTPDPDYAGADQIVFEAFDGFATSAPGTVDVTVRPVEDVPVADDLAVGTDEDVPVPVLLTGRDADGDPITFAIATPPTRGTLLGTPPSLTYVPDPDVTGTDTFTFTVSDGDDTSPPATVTVDVAPLNDPPVLTAQSFATDEDTPRSITVVASDPDGDPLVFAVTTPPTSGSLTGTGPDYTYTPDDDAFGTDTFAVTVDDGTATTGPVTMTIDVAPVADAPIADALVRALDEDTPEPLTLTARDADGDPLTFAIDTPPAHGALTGTPPTVTYTPDPDYSGTDSFTFTASDGGLTSTPARVSLTIRAVNDPPTVDALVFTTDEDRALPITLTGSDADGDTLAWTLVAAPTLGVLSGSLPTVTYTPDPDVSGTDSLVVRVSDGTTSSPDTVIPIDVLPVQDVPVAIDQTLTVTEDGSGPVTLAGTDADGDPLTFAVDAAPAHGTLSGAPPALTYTPDPDYAGPDTFTFTADDGVDVSAPATVRVTVTGVNDPPVLLTTAFSTFEDTATPIQLQTQDPDGDAVTVRVTASPTIGTLTGTPPSFTYTPDLDVTGTDQFDVELDDGTVVVPATVTITISGVTDPPVAIAQAASVDEDDAVTITLVGTDPDGDPLTYAIASTPSDGTLGALVGDTVTYTPDPDFHGTDAFTFTVSDGTVTSVAARVDLTVRPINDPPVLLTTAFVVDEDVTTRLELEAFDVDGDTVTAVVTSPTTLGSLTAVTTSTILAYTYDPDPDVSGADGFLVTLSDGTVTTAALSVTVDVLPINDPPFVADQVLRTDEDVPLAFSTRGTGPTGDPLSGDADGDPLSWTVVTPPAHGRLTGVLPNVVYTPDADYHGPDQVVVRANDGTVDSAPATLDLTVDPVNDAPSLADVSVTVAEDGQVDVVLPGADVDGDPLTFAVATAPTLGALGPLAGDTVAYTPDPDLSGTDTFTYTVSDGLLTTGPATATVTVTAVPDAPTVEDVVLSTLEDTPTGVTLRGDDVDGDPLTFRIVTGPSDGTLSGTPPALTYTPDPGFNGDDAFTYEADDGTGLTSNLGTVDIQVGAVNDPPVADAAAFTVAEDDTVAFVLTGSDPEGSPLSFLVSSPAHGQLVGSAPNLTYAPDPDYNGPDSFTFRVFDGALTSTPATVALTVTPVNDPAVAQSATLRTDEDTPVDLPFAATDVDGDPFTFVVDSVSVGTVVGVRFTPPADFNGTASIVYRADDGQGPGPAATLDVFVDPVNDPPVALVDQAFTTDEDVPYVYDAVATDVDGDPVTAQVTRPPAHGSLVVNGLQFTYTPAPDYHGPDDFGWEPFDGTDAGGPVDVFITVDPVNDAPVALGSSITTDEDTGVPLPFGGTDVEGDTLTYNVVSVTEGQVVGSAPPVFVPNADYNGPAQVVYRAFDGTAFSAPATIDVDVLPVNDAPVAQDFSGQLGEDGSLTIELVATDVDGDPLTWEIVDTPLLAILTGADGTYTFIPLLDVFGQDTFTFRVSDGALFSNVATATVDILPSQDPPTADDLSLVLDEDQTVVMPLSGSDPDGDPLTFRVLAVSDGFVDDGGGAGPFLYTPPADASGVFTVTYEAFDGVDASAPATVSLDVRPVNDPPVATDLAFGTDEDLPVDFTFPVADIEGDSLTFEVLSGPSSGTITGAGATRTYTPAAQFEGTDTFTWRAFDGTDFSNVATATITVDAVNDPPVAVDDVLVLDEDTQAPVPTAATDVEGSAPTFEILSVDVGEVLDSTGAVVAGGGVGPVPGSPVLDTAFNYRPPADVFGAATLTYRAFDGTDFGPSATIAITITPVNDAPVGTAGSVATDEDTPVSFDLVATDVEGDALTFDILTPPAAGSLSGTGARRTYTPAPDANGPDTFTWRPNDGTDPGAPVTTTIAVAAVNDPPVAASGTLTLAEDTPTSLPVSAVDVEGDPITYVILSTDVGSVSPTSGTGPFTYTPPADASGPATVTYRADDADPGPIATLDLTITPVNDAPVVADDVASTPEDTPVDITLVGTDVEGDTLTFTTRAGPGNGTLTRLGPDTFRYTPNPQYSGPDSFEYQADDGTDVSGWALLDITVRDVNDPPVATPQSVSVPEDGSLPITLTATDADGDPLTYAIVAPPTHGQLTGSGPSRTYVPDPDYFGPDQFTFRANDGFAPSAVVAVDITVLPVADDPVAFAGSVSLAEDTTAVLPLGGSDADGDAVSIETPTTDVGGVSFDGTDWIYTPPADYHGPATVTYRVTDGARFSPPTAIAVTVTPVNDRPVATAATFALDEDTPTTLTLQGTDVDGDPLTALPSPPTHGTLTPLGGNQFVYTPDADYHGPDGFDLLVDDGTLVSAPARIDLTVRPINDRPVVRDSAVSTPEDTPVVVVPDATDVDGDTLTFSVDAVSAGTAAPVTGGVQVTPPLDFVGDLFVTVRASDGLLTSAPATVTVTVTGEDDPPVLQAFTVSATEDAPEVFTVPVFDPDGDPITVEVRGGPAHGSLVPVSGFDFRYTPHPDYFGPDAFELRAVAGALSSPWVPISVTVAPTPDAPVATPTGPLTTPEDTPLTLTFGGTDVDGDAVTVSEVVALSGGTVSRPSGTWVFTPTPDVFGRAQVRFRVSDGALTSVPEIVDIDVTPVNDPPTAAEVAASIVEDTPTVLTLQASDVDGDPLTFETRGGPSRGSFDPVSRTYTPDADATGFDGFEYRAFDGAAFSGWAPVSLTITPVPDAPVARDSTATTPEDTTLTVTPDATDADGDTLTFNVLGVTNGSATPVTGGIAFSPDPDFFGTAVVDFTATDGTRLSNPAQITVTVTPVDDAPVGAPGSFSVDEDDSVRIALAGMDPDGDPITVGIRGGGPTLGSLTALGGGEFRYTPDPDAFGTDTFEYRVTDLGGLHSPWYPVQVTIRPVNDPPTLTTSAFSLPEDATGAPLSLVAFDVDGDAVTLRAVRAPTHGTLGGSFPTPFYVPDADYFGADAFDVELDDGTVTVTATVSLTVTPVNDPPVAQPSPAVTVSAGGTAVIPLVATDVDGDPLTYVIVSAPTLGGLGGTGPSRTYTAPSQAGRYTFDWYAEDPSGARSTIVTQVVDVTSTQRPPSALDDTFVAIGNTRRTIPSPGVLANDTDPDGDTLQVVPGTYPTALGGFVALNPGGGFTYDPPVGVTGAVDSVVYDATDGSAVDSAVLSLDLRQEVWFVQNDSTAAPQGTSWAPFTTLAAAQSAAGPGATIIVRPGDGSTTGMDQGISLQTGQTLLGAVRDYTPLGIPVQAAQGRPRLTSTSGFGVVLASGTLVEGLEIDSSQFNGIAGDAVDGVYVLDVTVKNTLSGANLQCVSCSNVNISSSRFEGAFAGVELLQVADALVDDNTFVGANGDAIAMSQATGDVQVLVNTMIQPSGRGLGLSSLFATDPLDLLVTGNQIDGDDAGIAGTSQRGIEVVLGTFDAVDLEVEVSGNVGSDFNRGGFLVTFEQDAGSGALATAVFNGNTVTGASGAAFEARTRGDADAAFAFFSNESTGTTGSADGLLLKTLESGRSRIQVQDTQHVGATRGANIEMRNGGESRVAFFGGGYQGAQFGVDAQLFGDGGVQDIRLDLTLNNLTMVGGNTGARFYGEMAEVTDRMYVWAEDSDAFRSGGLSWLFQPNDQASATVPQLFVAATFGDFVTAMFSGDPTALQSYANTSGGATPDVFHTAPVLTVPETEIRQP